MALRHSARGTVLWRSFLVLATAALLLALPGSLTSQTNRPDSARLTGPGSEISPSVAEVALPSALLEPWAARTGYDPSNAAEASGVAPASGTISVVVTLWPTNDAFFTPPTPVASALSTAQIANEFGTSPAQYASLQAYFISQGLSIAHAWPDRLSLTLRGSASAMGAAFGTSLSSGELAGHSVLFPTSAPSLPAPYASEVASISGLSTGFSAFNLPLVTDLTPAQSSTQTVTPNDIHLIYGLDDLYNFSGSSHFATGTKIAILLWGSGYDPADISTFLSRYYPSNFPAFTVTPVPVDGAPAPSANAVNDPSNSSQEMTLDIEWAGSEAPGVGLEVVYAPDGPATNDYSPTDADMEDAVNTAVNTLSGIDVLSMSFGSLDGGDLPFQSQLSMDFAEAAQKGMTVLAASGDTGGATKADCTGGPGPQFPASSPYVIAVGGTAPVLSVNAISGAVEGLESEPAWSDSGGGYSLTYQAPAWQRVGSAAAPIEANGGYRGIPDVSGPASQNLFFFDGAAEFGSGTSFSTPMWAGLVAEMDAVRGSPLGFLTPRLYQVGANGGGSGALVDITQGQTCVATAGPGWDAATGWGTPRALPLYEHLAGTFVDVNLSASPTSVAPGGSVQVTVVVTNATTHHPISALPLQFAMSGSFPGPCSGNLATANGSTALSGDANISLTVPSCYFGSSVSIVTTVSSGGYYGSNSTAIGVNLFGFGGLRALSEDFPYNVVVFALIIAIAALIGIAIGKRRHPPPGTARAPPLAPPPAATSGPAPPPPPVFRTPPALLPTPPASPSEGPKPSVVPERGPDGSS